MSISWRALEGDNTESPPAAARTARQISSGLEVFTKKPEAPASRARTTASFTSHVVNTTAQGQFFLVHLTIENSGDKAASFSGSFQTITDPAGREHETDGSAPLYLPDNDTLFTEINPGNTVAGTLVFDLPSDATPELISLQGGLFDETVDVRIAETS